MCEERPKVKAIEEPDPWKNKKSPIEGIASPLQKILQMGDSESVINSGPPYHDHVIFFPSDSSYISFSSHLRSGSSWVKLVQKKSLKPIQ